MVHYQRYHHNVKSSVQQMENCEALAALVCPNSGYYYNKSRTKPKLIYLLFLMLLSCLLFLVPNLFHLSVFSVFYSFGFGHGMAPAPSCSSTPNGTICCDRTSNRTDVCFIRGDVRTRASSSSIILYTSRTSNGRSTMVVDDVLQLETIKPYTRKWERETMATVGELNLVVKDEESAKNHPCDVIHNSPAVFFSTSGYTGNVYHEFNDGILPLYITSQHFKKKVVFVIQEYHTWWITKYANVLSQLSNYPAIDFTGDKRTHCFPEVIVGLKIHGELTINPSLMEENKTIVDFRDILNRAYWPRIKGLAEEEEREARHQEPQILKLGQQYRPGAPKLVILSRSTSRAILNENSLVKLAREIGFAVQVLRPEPTTELAKLYRSLNSSDVMIGVHGAAMTHMLFLRPGAVFIQVIPLGTDWAADNYYGEPARKLGVRYIGYRIVAEESSLYDEYGREDPVLRDPESVNQRGWQYTKSIYLDRQNVRLSLARFRPYLVQAFRLTLRRRD